MVELETAVGAVIAAPASSARAIPAEDLAALDGWAMKSSDLVTASAYAPAMLTSLPSFVAVGDAMPDTCDCVVEQKFVSIEGPLAEVRISAAPSDGVLRAGDDVADGALLFRAGDLIGDTMVGLGLALGLTHLSIRRPDVLVIDVTDEKERGPSTAVVCALIREAGGQVMLDRASRSVDSLTARLKAAEADLVVTIGATGGGKDDVAADALRQAGALAAHRLAIRPGTTTALGRVGKMSVIALPGRTPDAFAIALVLLLPALRRLTGTKEPESRSLTLKRKIASQIGFAELALFERAGSACDPIAVGHLPLSALARCDAWALVEAASEGFASGSAIDAWALGG